VDAPTFVIQLLSVATRPSVVILIALLVLRDQIQAILSEVARSVKDLLGRVGEIKIPKVGTAKFTAAALSATTTTLQKVASAPGLAPEMAAEVRTFITKLQSVIAQEAPIQTHRNRILWVDDHPEYNEFERRVLTQYGDTVIDNATSTADALKLLSKESYNLIISDMYREEDGAHVPDAGVRLLQRKPIGIPCFLYTGDIDAVDPAIIKIADGVFDSPAPLIEAVTTTLSETTSVPPAKTAKKRRRLPEGGG
jgi:CheY-like chemotaxis protein